jgi:antitoxin (DNA-binding transcriptional repressor) of toxin-antitoxin stability system
MEFVGVKELAQNTSKYVSDHDWVIVTKNGRPVKLMIDINGEELEDWILAKKLGLENQAKKAKSDWVQGKTTSLRNYLRDRKKRY